MKARFISTKSVAILMGLVGVFLIVGWRRQVGITLLKEERQRLVLEATRVGMPLEDDNPGHRDRARPRPSLRTAGEQAVSTDELIAVFRRVKASEREAADSTARQKSSDEGTLLLKRLMTLDESQLKSLVTGVVGAELAADERAYFLQVVLVFSANGKPQASADLAARYADALGGRESLANALDPILSMWARQQPEKAMAWLDAHRDLLKADTRDDLRAAIVKDGASVDPIWALDQVDPSSNSGTGKLIGMRLVDDAARTEMLEELRRRIGSGEKDAAVAASVLQGIGQKFAEMNFDEVDQWLDAANLTLPEAQRIAKGLMEKPGGLKDRAAWLSWMVAKFPEDVAERGMNQILPNWIQENYHASGEWIRSQKDGPVKQKATECYVQAMAGRFPDEARQWAMTLPPGETRNALLEQIEAMDK